MGVKLVDVEAAPPEPEQSRLAKLLEEARFYVASNQQELTVSLDGEVVVLSGPFIVTGAGGPFDYFHVVARFHESFPDQEPRIFETGGRVPRVADRHVYEGTGRCCICVWEEWLPNPKVQSIAGFMDLIVNDYFVSQAYFEAQSSWPYGVRSHGAMGVFEACCDLLAIELNPRKCIDMMFYCAGRPLKGHNPCICGSGKRFRSCHREHLDNVTLRVSRSIMQRLLIKLIDTIKAAS